ncbi:MAG: hypothetical protein ABI670_04250 [Chloroflexota bacterium]
MLDQTGTTRIPYEDVMLAIGAFLDESNVRDICIVELREGILVRGNKYSAERSGLQALAESFLFTREDIERIVNETFERRKQQHDAAVQAALEQQNQQKGGLFRR